MKRAIEKDFCWVACGRQRTAIIKTLDKPKTPKMLSVQTKIKFSNVSDVLRAFVKRKLARCLDEEAKIGRFYQLTKKGEAVRTEIIKR